MTRAMTPHDLYREEVTEARAMPPDRKLVAGLELFDRVRMFMIAGIRSQYPDAGESEVRQTLVQRLELARRLENRS